MTFIASCVLGTMYSALIGLMYNRLRTPLIAWPILIVLFWYTFRKWDLLRFSGYLAVLPVSIFSFEIAVTIFSPSIYADRYIARDRSHYPAGLRVPVPENITSVPGGRGWGLKEILIGEDGFRADPDTGQGNPERCSLVLIGDSMIYGHGLPYSDTLRPVLARMGIDACAFGVAGNSPLYYLSTLKYVEKRIEDGAYIAIYLYANDFVWDPHVLLRSSYWQFMADLIVYADRWRWATFTHRLFYRWSGTIIQRNQVKQHKKIRLFETGRAKILTHYDPTRYSTPSRLNKRERDYLEFFFMGLLDVIRKKPWRVSVVSIPDGKEVMANLARQLPMFKSLDMARVDALRICRTFLPTCEDLAPYFYKRLLDEGKNPTFIDDLHFSAFGNQILAEHYLAIMRQTLHRSTAHRNLEAIANP